ncbi:lipid IV(A) 3-deoxy-D-manno-octulosonic acid transferase [Reinekea sp.]|jgi:3-deoxy-D-manno-octulosonic-acid transferase|uniref:lipid IV(A) 3-deoxy-D-manno-octulosonic acid transferase n=1 Tax=Reinekea sp. TaxID=1970455 RepID=UPI002A83ACCF|nr:lipid IV(A) 3-deoxy-D-manno-octulosonic acid transferase [Reinekea sp.]
MKTRLALTAYSLIWRLLLPLVLLRLWLKGRRQPDYRLRWAERMGHWPLYPQGCLWIHAVSVGETIAAKGLVEQWQKRHPDIPILLTSMTPTGSAAVRKLFGTTVHHAYLPWDLPGLQGKLVERLQPRLLVIMETELWPNLIHACRRAEVPILLANARLSEKSQRGYQRVSALSRPMLKSLTGIAAQHTPDADRFVALGVDERKLQVTGSIKFDTKLDARASLLSKQLLKKIGTRPIWIAASTHDGEEELLLRAHSKLKVKLPDALLILVPRHPERADRIGGLLYKQHFQFARRSLDQVPTPEQSVFLVDTLGELMTFYGLAQAAYVGNSLTGGGGQNPIEPASLAIPVLMGPGYTNFLTIVEAMRAEQAVVIVESVDELRDRLLGLLQSKDLRDTYGQRAYLFYQHQQGALKRLLTWIENLINLHSTPTGQLLLMRRKPVNENRQ